MLDSIPADAQIILELSIRSSQRLKTIHPTKVQNKKSFSETDRRHKTWFIWKLTADNKLLDYSYVVVQTFVEASNAINLAIRATTRRKKTRPDLSRK